MQSPLSSAMTANMRQQLGIELMQSQPAVVSVSPLALQILIGLKRYDEAELLMRAGRKRHPNDPYFAKGLAEVAQARREIPTAIQRWAFLRKRFPGVVEGYTLGADALLENGQFSEAEALALDAIKRFPENIGGHLTYARLASRTKNWQEALRRWQPVRDDFKFVGGYTDAAEALCHLGRYEEAEELLRGGRIRFGDAPALHCQLARVAEAKGDMPEAAKRWQDVLYRFPLDMNVHVGVSEAFERLGQPAEAKAALHAAIDRFPTELRPRLELAKLLQYKHRNFAAAADAWAGIREVLPDNQEAYTSGADALRQAGRTEEADALRQAFRARFPSS